MDVERHLTVICDSVENGTGIPSEVAEWLVHGVGEWVKAGRKEPLEKALGIQSAPDYLKERNEWIRKAATELHISKPSRAARMLSEEIKEFRDTVWRNTKHLSEPPPELSEIRYALWNALKANSYLPSDNDERRFPASSLQIRKLIDGAT